MRSLLLPVAGVLSLATLASAQDDVRERKGYASLGVYVGTDGNDNVGLAYAVGGNVLTRERYRVGLEFHGSVSRISGFGDDLTLSVNSLFANYSTRPTAGRGFFFGGGLGLGKASISRGNVSFSDNELRFVYQAFAGYDFTPTTYALGRYQGSDREGYRGVSVEFGYRF